MNDCENCIFSTDAPVGCTEFSLAYFLMEADGKCKLMKKRGKIAIPIIHEYRDTNLTVTQCGNCLAQLFLEKQKYCTECGSRIDWSI